VRRATKALLKGGEVGVRWAREELNLGPFRVRSNALHAART
jgi:hypothetical protein